MNFNTCPPSQKKNHKNKNEKIYIHIMLIGIKNVIALDIGFECQCKYTKVHQIRLKILV